MNRMLRAWIVPAMIVTAWSLSQPVDAADPPPPPPKGPPTLKPLIVEELGSIEKAVASRMMRRPALPADQRVRLELAIDLRIMQRAVIALAAEAKFDTHDQAVAWLRGRSIRDAIKSLEDALGPENAPAPAGASQRDAMAQIHKLSFTELKGIGALDEYCRSLAVAMANVVNASPVTAAQLPPMRPKPAAASSTAGEPRDRPPTVAELAEEVQRVAAISVPLRQQLLALATAAQSAATDEEGRALYNMLSQSVGLAKGLQSNTAVGGEARTAIEAQLTEGIVLYSDPRTRDAGKSRVESLGAYRQTLTRIGKMGLSAEQMNQLAPAFTYAQANPETGAKLLATIEGFIDIGGKWDMLPQGVTIPTALKRPHDDLKAQFAKVRASFLADAGARPGMANLEESLAELQRVYAITDDVQSMQASFDVINAYKVRPVGGIERKVTTAALAAATPIASPNRADGQRYLSAVHALARLSQALTARPLTDVPPAVLSSWTGGKLDAFEAKWRAIVVDLANSLNAGTIDLDKAKVARLETAQTMIESLRAAAQVEAATPKLAALARWVDWSADAASFELIMTPYREATAAAFAGYATDLFEAVDKWAKMRGRYAPLAALILRDVAYAEQCQAMPIGLPADLGRLAAPFDGAPFGIERHTSYALGAWAVLERTGEHETADRLAAALARRLIGDLRLKGIVVVADDEAPARPNRRGPRP